MELKPGQRVLDVGCGIGGGDFYMAAEHGVSVHGIDLSVNMVLIAIERAGKVPGGASVSFEIADCTLVDYAHSSFDVIYSRDTILHIQDKPALFKKCAEWLKPGGKLLISDYCRSPEKPSGSFAKYIEQRGYDLHSVAGYGKMIEDAGFINVEADDRTWQVCCWQPPFFNALYLSPLCGLLQRLLPQALQPSLSEPHSIGSHR